MPRYSGALASTALILATAVMPPETQAAWPSDPDVNLPLCLGSGFQGPVRVVSDGAGGVIAAWEDDRGTSTDIYAQHVLVSGIVDPAWPVDGVLVCGAPQQQNSLVAVSDGGGGALLVWEDYRNGGGDLYAQHVLANVGLDPAWPAGGAPVSAALGSQSNPTVVVDATGGCFIAWQDGRPGGQGWDIYAQHLLANGAVDPQWPTDGTPICLAAAQQQFPSMATDGASGVIVAWADWRNGTDNNIYAHHLLATSHVDPQWPSNGRLVCNSPDEQLAVGILEDGERGAFLVWTDYRTSPDSDVYASHVRANGAIDPSWPANGLGVGTGPRDEWTNYLISDGAGGAIVSWSRFSVGSVEFSDVFAQHIVSTGIDPAWPATGRSLCGAPNRQMLASLVSDGAGGAIAAWWDERNTPTDPDIYAHHLLSNGNLDPAWPIDGAAICTATGDQANCAIASDGVGGAIIAWMDDRAADTNIFAQRVQSNGALGGDAADVHDVTPRAMGTSRVWPNPSAAGVWIDCSLPAPSLATLTILSPAGRVIRELAGRSITNASPELYWDARDRWGQRVPSGVYLYRIATAAQTIGGRIVIRR